jgi:hypothetical protein
MAKAQKTEETNVTNISNSADLEKLIVQSATEMAEIDAQRKKLNGEAAEIREVLKDRGVDRDAFRDVYGYYKKRRHEKDGYDESHKICMDALNKADTADMFSFQDDKD